MKKLIFIAFQVHLSLCTFGQDISMVLDSNVEIYCVGNVHFDGIHYRKNKAYLYEVAKNEKREAYLYEMLISKGGVGSILLEYPVHDELYLNYIYNASLDSAINLIDTINFPSAYYADLRLRRIVNDNPHLKIVCVDIAEEENRVDFMSSLLYATLSQYKPLKDYFLFPEYQDGDTYVSIWEEYRWIVDSLAIEGYDEEYINLLNDALEVRFFESCKKKRVRLLVEEFKLFYSVKHPDLATPFILRMCNSYISKRTSHQKLERERFIFKEVTEAVTASDSVPVLLQMGKWHFQANTENNLRYFFEKTALNCTYLKLYQSLFSFWYSKSENELAIKAEREEVVEVDRNDYLIFE